MKEKDTNTKAVDKDSLDDRKDILSRVPFYKEVNEPALYNRPQQRRLDDSEDELSENEVPKPVLRLANPRSSKSSRVDQVDGDEDDEYFGTQLKKNRRKSASRLPNIETIDDSLLLKHETSNEVTKIKDVPIKNRIRLRMSNFMPKMFQRPKSRNYKLQFFVSLTFLVIILLVGSIYVIHHEKEQQKAYFDRIRFSGLNRRIRVSNLKGREVLSGILGMNLNDKDRPWECLEKNRKSERETCLEWMNIARLYFKSSNPRRDWDPAHNNMQCYQILWESISSNFVPMDCYHIGEKQGFSFYGGGELDWNSWPLNRVSIPLSPFISGRKIGGTEGVFQWGRSLRPFFLGSPGVAIEVSNTTPLHISINSTLLCIAAKADSFSYPNHQPPHSLNYTFCTGESVRDVLMQLADKDIWDGLKHEDVHATHAIAASPIWRIGPARRKGKVLTEASLLNHTDHITGLPPSEGFILLDETWQRHMGDLELDLERFPTMEETVNITRRRGFKVALTIQPFFSTESINYLDGMEKEIWVMQNLPGFKGSQNAPALTSYKGAPSAVLLDITHRSAQAWIQEKLRKLISISRVDGIFVDFGSTHDFPQNYHFREPLSTPDEYKEIFMKAVKNLSRVLTIGTTSATKLPKLPTFVFLSPTASTWSGIQSIIPNLLTLGIGGFPFISPGVIGGDFLSPSHESRSNKTQIEEDVKPERELYMRWLELAHFLPVVQFSHLPSDYDSEMIQLAQKLRTIRRAKVYPYIRKGINDALTTGLPIIQPLWMSDPEDSNCLKIWDEFTIGGDILVAPILNKSLTEREIYLPKGRWRDEMDGSSTKGERWIHHYKVKMDQIAYFTKVEESGN